MTTAYEKFERLCHAGKVCGPVDNQLIAQAEADLGVKLPSEYRDIIKKYGAVLAKGVEIYGLPDGEVNDPPLWQNVVSVTRWLQKWGMPGADRKGFIPICDDGTGVYFYLDTSVSPETKIWAIGPGIDRIVSVKLFEFVRDFSAGNIVT